MAGINQEWFVNHIKAESHLEPLLQMSEPCLVGSVSGKQEVENSSSSPSWQLKKALFPSACFIFCTNCGLFCFVGTVSQHLLEASGKLFLLNKNLLNEWDKIPLPPLIEKCILLYLSSALSRLLWWFITVWLNEDKGMYSKRRLWSLYYQEKKLLGIGIQCFIIGAELCKATYRIE